MVLKTIEITIKDNIVNVRVAEREFLLEKLSDVKEMNTSASMT